MDLKQVFLEHLDTIEKAAAHACRRYGLGREDTEDFTQHVELKICADDYAVLRKYRGLAKLSTFLVAVVQKAMQDYVNSMWGKWRPSADAKRLGAVAVRLERLLVRDQLGFREACQVLWTNDRQQVSEETLRELAAKLPPRLPRRPDVSLETGSHAGGAGGGSHGLDARQLAAAESTDERVVEDELERRRLKVLRSLAAALRSLSDEDRRLALLSRELRIVEIARTQHLEQKALYKRMKKIWRSLRLAMERDGISATDISDLLGHADH